MFSSFIPPFFGIHPYKIGVLFNPAEAGQKPDRGIRSLFNERFIRIS